MPPGDPQPPVPEAETRRAAPAWRRRTEGETVLGVCVAVLVATALQWFLPERLSPGPRWLVPALAIGLLIAVVSLHPGRMSRRTVWGRAVGVTLLILLGLSNLISGVLLVLEIVGQRPGTSD